MSAKVFLDTNILVYAAIRDTHQLAKHERALAIIRREAFCSSAQVLQEFYVTMSRKIAQPLTPLQALAWIEQLTAFPCLAIDHYLVRSAIEISERYRLAYWDAAIIAAAEALSCEQVYSEDFNHGQHYGAVQVLNPFL